MNLSPRVAVRALSDALAIRIVCSSFPSVRRAPRGRLARARLVAFGLPIGSYVAPVHMCGPVMVVWVPVCAWAGRLGAALLSWAFSGLGR